MRPDEVANSQARGSERDGRGRYGRGGFRHNLMVGELAVADRPIKHTVACAERDSLVAGARLS